MAKTIYPHKRTIALGRDHHAAVKAIARWRGARESEVIRAACEEGFKREYALRGVPYPPTAPSPLPGQLAHWKGLARPAVQDVPLPGPGPEEEAAVTMVAPDALPRQDKEQAE